MYNNMKEFSLTKRIAKHGDQAVIIIPKMLQGILKPRTMVGLKIKVLDDGAEMNKDG